MQCVVGGLSISKSLLDGSRLRGRPKKSHSILNNEQSFLIKLIKCDHFRFKR
jgi:hypothetical protein